jgi:hypothetical protein
MRLENTLDIDCVQDIHNTAERLHFLSCQLDADGGVPSYIRNHRREEADARGQGAKRIS